MNCYKIINLIISTIILQNELYVYLFYFDIINRM